MPSAPVVRLETTFVDAVIRVTLASGKQLVTAWRLPIGTLPVGASFVVVVGTTKGLILIGP